jgi:hypothetical protein
MTTIHNQLTQVCKGTAQWQFQITSRFENWSYMEIMECSKFMGKENIGSQKSLLVPGQGQTYSLRFNLAFACCQNILRINGIYFLSHPSWLTAYGHSPISFGTV